MKASLRIGPGLCLLLASAMLAAGCSGKGEQASSDQGPRQEPSSPANSLPAGIPGGGVQRVEANVETVGTRGRSYGGGIISEPVSQLFKQKDRIHLMQLEQVLKLYKAEHGSLPRTHEEFMQKIVNNPQYGIRLPELPPGHRYVWDPKQEKLLVERPASAPGEKQP